jgi:hypothetical protein
MKLIKTFWGFAFAFFMYCVVRMAYIIKKIVIGIILTPNHLFNNKMVVLFIITFELTILAFIIITIMAYLSLSHLLKFNKGKK